MLIDNFISLIAHYLNIVGQRLGILGRIFTF